jgi:hypothetical protein
MTGLKLEHEILTDDEFWTNLEYVSSKWLKGASSKELRRLWIDGFVPERLKKTNNALEVTGTVWLYGTGTEDDYTFVASIPRTKKDFVVGSIEVNHKEKLIEISLSAALKS